MTASQTATNTAKASQRSSRSSNFITKVAAPFFTKQRGTVEQEIRLDEPFRQYCPGDWVKGAVHLNVLKPVRATHLVVRLHGFVKVTNNAKSPGESVAYDEDLLTSTKGRRGIEYFGNGFARLFEDEITLCGDGRLLGQYVFNFELALPTRKIPSSISFEHGTISYLVTSTLTRPTSISPTHSVHRTVNVTEIIDVARIKKPKPHVVTLEVVGKRAKAMSRARRASLGPGNGADSDSLGAQGLDNASPVNHLTHDVPPQSPVPSELSAASLSSSANSGDYETINMPQLVTHGSSSTDCSASALPSRRVITAQTELFQGACIAGDALPVKVSIDHIKAIKSMQGLIITLYRQGRIDTHPALPQGPSASGKIATREDYYPKSLTGLGGLSLRSAGSSRTFRQDLAQTITPLIVDPQTLTATVKTSIQIPEHVFPTITCVPGAMISFRYYVEVVIDLRGKLASQDKFLPRLNMISNPKHAYGDPKISKFVDGDGISFTATPGFNYLITDQIRRAKGVVFTSTEVVIGTRDSSRTRSRLRQSSTNSSANIRQDVSGNSRPERLMGDAEVDTRDRRNQFPEDDGHPIAVWTEHRVPYVAPSPEIEEDMDEKAQIRRAEQRLLPSAPPDDDPSSLATRQAASAPPALDVEDFVNRYALRASSPAYDNPPPPSFLDSTSPTSQIPIARHQISEPGSTTDGDDKAELERHRLQTLVSSPDVSEEEANIERDQSETMPLQPSAPRLSDL